MFYVFYKYWEIKKKNYTTFVLKVDLWLDNMAWTGN